MRGKWKIQFSFFFPVFIFYFKKKNVYLCLQLELRPTGTAVRPKNPDYLGLKTQTLPDHSLKNVRWVGSPATDLKAGNFGKVGQIVRSAVLLGLY